MLIGTESCCTTRVCSRCGPRLAQLWARWSPLARYAGRGDRVCRRMACACRPDQRTRIGANGQFSQLSANAAAGVRAWDPQARAVLRIGPLDRSGFERLLPDRMALHRLVSLIRAYVGFEIGFAINPVLAADAVPLRPGTRSSGRPGWNTCRSRWLAGNGALPTRPNRYLRRKSSRRKTSLASPRPRRPVLRQTGRAGSRQRNRRYEWLGWRLRHGYNLSLVGIASTGR